MKGQPTKTKEIRTLEPNTEEDFGCLVSTTSFEIACLLAQKLEEVYETSSVIKIKGKEVNILFPEINKSHEASMVDFAVGFELGHQAGKEA